MRLYGTMENSFYMMELNNFELTHSYMTNFQTVEGFHHS